MISGSKLMFFILFFITKYRIIYLITFESSIKMANIPLLEVSERSLDGDVFLILLAVSGLGVCAILLFMWLFEKKEETQKEDYEKHLNSYQKGMLRMAEGMVGEETLSNVISCVTSHLGGEDGESLGKKISATLGLTEEMGEMLDRNLEGVMGEMKIAKRSLRSTIAEDEEIEDIKEQLDHMKNH